MAKLSKTKLQNALNGLAKANNRANKYRRIIDEHCLEIYGETPTELDNDSFIDLVDGGCGDCPSMTAEEFDESMKHSIELRS